MKKTSTLSKHHSFVARYNYEKDRWYIENAGDLVCTVNPENGTVEFRESVFLIKYFEELSNLIKELKKKF